MKHFIAFIALTLSYSAFAAVEITPTTAKQHQQVGVISTVVHNGTIEEVINSLSIKADNAGAKYFVITSAGNAGMGDNIRGTAAIYR
jgi:hypothetical protein